jgi:predicted nucleotidyltransferase
VERLTPLFDWEERLRQELIDLLRTQILRRASSSVAAAYLFGSAAGGEMASTSDIDIAILHKPCATEDVTAALEEISEEIQQRYGNRLSFILTDSLIAELQERRGPGSRLWKQILREGVPILQPRPERGVG